MSGLFIGALNLSILSSFCARTYGLRHAKRKTETIVKELEVAQQVLRTLDKNWQSFFKAITAWRDDPTKFLGCPKLPKYKDKQQGRNLLIYTVQALSRPALRQSFIIPSMLAIRIETKHQYVDQVRIIPRHGFYVMEVVYEQEPVQADVDPSLYAGIDIGVNNLATLTSNKQGFVPRIVNGRPLKSENQYYNKRKAELDKKLMKMDARRRTSHQLERLTMKRTRRINHYLHTASRRIIALLIQERIGTLIIGKNPNWKQEVTMGKRTISNSCAFLMLVSLRCWLIKLNWWAYGFSSRKSPTPANAAFSTWSR